MELWKENNASELTSLLEHIISIWKEKGGYTFSIKNSIAYNEFLSSIISEEFVRDAVRITLTEMKLKSKNSLLEFSEIYKRIKIELSKKKINQKKCTFYIPIEADFDSKISFPITITLLGTKFQIIKRIPFSKKLLKNIPFQIIHCHKDIVSHITDKNCAFISIVSYGKDWESAWEKITFPFDVLRGIIEFSSSYRSFLISSHSKPRARIPHPKWVIILDEKKVFDGGIYDVQDYKIISKFRFTPSHITVIKNNARTLQKFPSNNSSKQLLASCLRLYSNAMDGYYNNNQFLALWNIAEAISLSEDSGGETKKVAKRLAWFGKNSGLVSSGYKNILDSLSVKRNNLVHKGISEISGDDVNHLKFAIDTAILWLFNSITKFKSTQHLLNFYRLKDINEKELYVLKQTIEIINKSR